MLLPWKCRIRLTAIWCPYGWMPRIGVIYEIPGVRIQAPFWVDNIEIHSCQEDREGLDATTFQTPVTPLKCRVYRMRRFELIWIDRWVLRQLTVVAAFHCAFMDDTWARKNFLFLNNSICELLNEQYGICRSRQWSNCLLLVEIWSVVHLSRITFSGIPRSCIIVVMGDQ